MEKRKAVYEICRKYKHSQGAVHRYRQCGLKRRDTYRLQIAGGNHKIRGCEHILGAECRRKDIYERLPDMDTFAGAERIRPHPGCSKGIKGIGAALRS